MSQPCFIRLHPGLHSRYLFQQYSTGPSDVFLTSNQLFGTLVRYWLQLHPSASQEEINRFATELHISSLFPGFQIFEEKTDVLFVPFPICPIHNENKLDVNSSGLHNHQDTVWNTQYHPAWISMHLLHFLRTFYDNGKLQLNDHFYSKARELFPGFWIHKMR